MQRCTPATIAVPGVLPRAALRGCRPLHGGPESDEYDVHAIHFAAATDRGEVVATLRLVLDSPLDFPLERHAPGLLDDRPPGERSRTGEVSRLIIAARYRTATIREPLILFGLFRHLYEEAWRLGLDYLVAAMEGKLARLLRRLGFPFVPLGDPISYYGGVRRTGRPTRQCGPATSASLPISGAAQARASLPSAIPRELDPLSLAPWCVTDSSRVETTSELERPFLLVDRAAGG